MAAERVPEPPLRSLSLRPMKNARLPQKRLHRTAQSQCSHHSFGWQVGFRGMLQQIRRACTAGQAPVRKTLPLLGGVHPGGHCMVQAGSRRARLPLWFDQIILEVVTYGTYSSRRTRAYFVRFQCTGSGKPFRSERQPCRQALLCRPPSPSVPVEITGADGQHFTVSFWRRAQLHLPQSHRF